jgi:LPS-assembly lipoprotein
MLAMALGLGALSGGCLRPLYADSTIASGGGSVREALRAIEVLPIPDLAGHYLRNELVFDLDGTGQEAPKRYKLAVTLSETTDVVVVNSISGRADSATLILTASWALSSSDGKVLYKGQDFARVTYDRSAQQFATLRAARDARIRGAKTLSGMIRNRLAASFASGS